MDISHNSSPFATESQMLENSENRHKYFGEASAKQLTANEAKVLLWIKSRTNQLTIPKKIVLRVRDASHFGFKTRFATRMNGALTLIEWRSALSRFQPNLLEIYGSANPLPYLVYSLEFIDGDEAASSFFNHVRELAVLRSDALFVDVEQVLRRLDVLAALTLNEVCFGAGDFDALVAHLERLNLRAIGLAGGLPGSFLEKVFASLQLQVVAFCPESGLRVAELTACQGVSTATRLVYVQEVAFDIDETMDAPMRLLCEILPRLFPNLEVLLWDWTVVEPFDARSKKIIDALVDFYKKIKPKVMALPLYTPYKEVLEDVGQICDIFKQHNLPFQKRRFCSSASVSSSNFTLLCVGEAARDDDAIASSDPGGAMERLCAEMVLKSCTRFDELTPLLYIATGESLYERVDEAATTLLDFGGFDAANIRERNLARDLNI